MSLITSIDGVPLYTTVAEAMLWGSQYDLTGYHQHVVLGQTGYMGGGSHAQIVQAMVGGTTNSITPTQIRTTSSSSSSSSGGGGGGY